MKKTQKSTVIFLVLGLLLIGGMVWQMLPKAAAGNKEISNKGNGGVINNSVSEDPALILLNAAPINTKSDFAKKLRKPVENFSGKQMHIVKFAGPIQPENVAMLEGAGLEIVDYVPNYSYIVYGDAPSLQEIQNKATNASSGIEWDGSYLPEYRISPDVFLSEKADGRSGLRAELFTVQMYKDEAANSVTIDELNALRTKDIVNDWTFSKYRNIIIGLNEEGIRQISKRPDVISIHPETEMRKLDERQNRIVTGFLTGNAPTPGNHLSYLASKGFTQAQFDTSNFSVNVVDSGVDNASTSPTHFALRRLGDPAGASRFTFSRLVGTPNGGGSTLQGCDGHGNLNAHIVGGYVPDGAPFNAFPHSDTSGYRYGLGVAPFVKLGSSVVFDPNTFTNPDVSVLENQAYTDGARISTNSWGNGSNLYQARTQTYDGLVRDAQAGTAGNQEMTILFAAGNSGPGANTVGNPATGKNVISVGASENVHPFGGSDGCATPDSQADSANDMVGFSSRGPTSDGRKKPDIVAPGTHVTGGVAQATNVSPVSGTGARNTCYTGNGVCGGVSSIYFPSTGQQWYTASSGTSHSTPAVAGGAALVRQYFINRGLSVPSPALTKALLMNSTNYMTGVGANDNLFSNSQGMGLMNLDRAFSTIDNPHIIRDQVGADMFTASGQQRAITGTVASSSQPFRVTLAYSDAPGSTTGNAYVNDLDLEVTVGGQSYRGNVFTNGNSVTGGTADVRNNVESVFVPAGVSGPFVVRVRGTNIAGNGVPNNSSTLDQDYALIISNATEAPLAVLDGNVTYVSENGTPPNNTPDPGETVTVNLNLSNVGTANSGNVTATLQNSGGITNPSGPQNYGNLPFGGAAVSRPFTFTVPASAACGSTITLTFQVQDGANTTNVTRQYTLGTLQQTFTQNFDGVTAPALPTGWTATQTDAARAWVTSATTPSSAPNTAFAPNPTTTGEASLETPDITVNSASARLQFKNNYNVENAWDGMVLEIKIGSGAFQDITAAGGTFVSGGYVRALNTSANPLGGRQAWTGNSSGFIDTVVNLPASLNGQVVRFRWRMGTDASVGGAGVRVDDVVLFGNFTCASVSNTVRSRADFDGDGRTDPSVYRNGVCHLSRSTAGYTAIQWGAATDIFVGGDIDGDGKADMIVHRPSSANLTPDFYVLRSSDSTIYAPDWGTTGDVPVIGDYAGDSRDDLGVWRPSTNTFFILPTGGGSPVIRTTQAGTPVVMDWDGDGKDDFTNYSNGVWTINQSSGAPTRFIVWGTTGDILVPADYDNDNRDDVAVFRPSNGVWYILQAGNNASVTRQWGSSGDIPVPGDYNGDGADDIAIFRNGTWFANTATGVQIVGFGVADDKPIPRNYLPQPQ